MSLRSAAQGEIGVVNGYARHSPGIEKTMSEPRYDIAYSGRCREGVDPAEGQLKLAKLLKVTPEKLEPVFAGRRATLARGADAAKARAYKTAFEKIGAIPEISEAGGGDSARPAAGRAEAAAEPPRAPALTVAEVGATLVETETLEPPQFDLSGLELAEVGADLVESSATPPPEFDLSALSLAPPGTDLDTAPRPAPARIDTSGLEVAADSGDGSE